MARRRIAVIGSGSAGLTAAHVMQRSADVTLYEAADKLGGHADTHEIVGSDGVLRQIDTGFIVHNEKTYPTLMRLFGELGIRTQVSDMSMSISCRQCGLEYAGGRGVSGLLPSVRAVSKPQYLRMLLEVKRFHVRAKALLAGGDDERTLDAITLGRFLADGGFSPYFVSHFMTPLVAAVWSTAPSHTGDYPARFLFRFLANHGMLSVRGAPTWRTVVGGSARYVERAAKELAAVHTATPVRALTRTAEGVRIHDDADDVRSFDAVVVATHPGQALTLLSGPSPAQSAVLGAIGYTVNPTILHTDDSVLPRTPRAQASWNYQLPECLSASSAVHLSYNMNRLQRLSAPDTYVVTLNGEDRIDPASIIDRMVYEHPVYTTESVAARGRLPELNDGVVAFAGAYHGWGFHEDGCRSGVEAAESLGCTW